MIPLLIFPAYQIGWGGVAIVALAFSIATIGMMLLMTYLLGKGISIIKLKEMERYVHALAKLALDGVDGHPGGQDNVAIAAAQT